MLFIYTLKYTKQRQYDKSQKTKISLNLIKPLKSHHTRLKTQNVQKPQFSYLNAQKNRTLYRTIQKHLKPDLPQNSQNPQKRHFSGNLEQCLSAKNLQRKHHRL